MGLATRICDDPRAEAFELAREIAGKSPDAIRAAKRMLNNLSVDPGPALLAESVEQMQLMGGANQLEAVRANIDKRAPQIRRCLILPRPGAVWPQLPSQIKTRITETST